MASTSATRRQSEAIRATMREIRSELPYDVDDARERLKQLSDWRYHLSRRPYAVLGAAAVLGYVLMPAKRTSKNIVVHPEKLSSSAAAPAKRGLVGGIVGAFTTLLLRQAAVLATNQIANKLSQHNTNP